ncbi:elongation factor P [Candidatus Erwinia haradaeae]|uniref:Elongation factor P n=1 Tax=Candidatus Erwinia haradaeae TaxID=1922217 RepID=A0A451DHY8_9GAMM|nr:elongation factor P [Candidatus Erwinia haradaeae]VFP86274.1 Elongation factor P [Candidatus Erwinia haradaeae]
MPTYSVNNFRPGLKIIFDGEPCTIESSEFVKPGKGQAFARIKMRRLLTGGRLEKTFKATETLCRADIEDISLHYLYNDGIFFYFMHPKSFEQYEIEAIIVGNTDKWLFRNAECLITLWNNRPIQVLPPNFVELEIVNTNPGLKGDTSSTSTKPALLSTGATVKVPLFIKIGEIIKIDTRSGEYVSRVKYNISYDTI